MSDEYPDDESLDLILGLSPVEGAKQLAARPKAALTGEELDLLDIAALASTGGIAKDERQAWAARVVEATKGARAYRHAPMIRSVIALAATWRNGLDGDRELVAVRNDVAGHFRSRYERRKMRADNAR